MGYSTYLGELTYLLVLDKSKFDQGIKVAKEEFKGLGREGDAADIKMKKLAGDVSILGGSLATMGGLAMGAGLALGDSGLGGALTTAGMGMSILGGTLATIVPAMKGLAVVVQGQLIPALIALNAFLGPAGWLIIGLGLAAAATAIFISKTKDAKAAIDDQKSSINLNVDALKKLSDAYDEVKDAQDKLAGIPKKKEDLEFELAGAKLDEKAAYEQVQKAVSEGVTGTQLEQTGYSYLSAQRRRKSIEDALASLPAEQAAAQAAAAQAVSAYNTKYMHNLEAGSVGAVSQGGNVTGLLGLGAMADRSSEAQKYQSQLPQGYIQQTNNINVTVSSAEEAKQVISNNTTGRILYDAKRGGYLPS